MAAARQQRDVEIVARSGAAYAEVPPTADRRKAVFLMNGDRKNIRPLGEDGFRPIAVMNVPVDDGDAAQLVLGNCRLDRDRGIVEKAEAHWTCGSAMLPWRAGGRGGVTGAPAEHFVDRRNHEPGGAPRIIVA